MKAENLEKTSLVNTIYRLRHWAKGLNKVKHLVHLKKRIIEPSEEAELIKLRKENLRLKMENDILMQAALIIVQK